jgi:hypothetical protein
MNVLQGRVYAVRQGQDRADSKSAALNAYVGQSEMMIIIVLVRLDRDKAIHSTGQDESGISDAVANYPYLSLANYTNDWVTKVVGATRKIENVVANSVKQADYLSGTVCAGNYSVL